MGSLGAFRYRFVGAFERIFPHLVHGHDVAVKRKDKAAEDVPGSTVVLAPGDEITLTAIEQHPELDPADTATKAAHKAAAEQPAPAAEPAPAADTAAPAEQPAPPAAS